jgi:hypothetical protein
VREREHENWDEKEKERERERERESPRTARFARTGDDGNTQRGRKCRTWQEMQEMARRR